MRRFFICAGALALALGSARAQADYSPPPITVTAAVNTLAATRGEEDPRIFLYRTSYDGLEQRVWSGSNATGSWEPSWTRRAQSSVRGESFFGTSIAAVGGEYYNSTYGLFLPRFHAFYDFEAADRRDHLGIGAWNWWSTAYSFSELTTPQNSFGDSFQPFSGFTWKQGSTQRINMFGLTSDEDNTWCSGCYNNLRELFFDGASWRFSDHGRPYGVLNVQLGPSSAVWTTPSGIGQGYVFMSGDDEQLHYRYFGSDCRSPTGWCWFVLGKPSNTTEMRAPVVVEYTYGGTQRVTAFVVARTTYGLERLYSRHHNGITWEGWQDWGSPPQVTSSQQGFDMRSAVVWYAGSTLRINLFGNTDRNVGAGAFEPTGGELVEFSWDGSAWGFRQTASPSAPTRPFRVMSAVVVDTQSWDRLSVFAEDSIGATWERFWNGSAWSWSPR